jgi:hypothetical protein
MTLKMLSNYCAAFSATQHRLYVTRAFKAKGGRKTSRVPVRKVETDQYALSAISRFDE